MLMDMTAPGYDVAGSTPFFMDLLREPILHLARHPNNVTYKKFRDAKEGIGAIPEQSHKTLRLPGDQHGEQRQREAVCIRLYPQRVLAAVQSAGAVRRPAGDSEYGVPALPQYEYHIRGCAVGNRNDSAEDDTAVVACEDGARGDHGL